MQLCNLHLVVCINQSHHILKLARQWKFPICNAWARWALFQISFRPQQEIGEKLGDGRTIHSGPSFARLRYIHYQEYISSKSVQLLQTAFLHVDVTSKSVNPISGGTSCTYVNHSSI